MFLFKPLCHTLPRLCRLLPPCDPTFTAKWGDFLRRICLCPAFFLRGAQWRLSLACMETHSLTQIYLLKSESDAAVSQRFLLFNLLFYFHPRGEKKIGGNATTVSGVNTQASSSALSLLTPPPYPPTPTPPPCLLLRPISAEQWSVKKFPISKFTHCINLV